MACDERLKPAVGRRALCASLLALPLVAGATRAAAPEESWVAPLAAKSLLLDVAAFGDKRIAVGARGHILVSDDAGASWKQSAHVPTLALLTAVTLIDDRHAWAVGHDEVILRTSDGGVSWQKVHESIEAQRPLLDVWFRDSRQGIAIGAYSAYYTTADGGETWVPRHFADLAVPGQAKPIDGADEDGIPIEYHLNHIAQAGGRLFIAAEAGHVYRSDDMGASWRALPLPYDGSMYGLLPLEGDWLLVFGLRGNLFRSDDAGESWADLPTGTVAMLTAGVRLDAATLAIVGLAGAVLVSRDDGRSFTLEQRADRKGLAAAVAAGDDALLVVGEAGIERVALR